MAIKGLTRQLNEAGKIKIGIKGKMITSTKGNDFRPPEKLDHFLITTTDRDSDGDYIVDEALKERIFDGESCIINDDGNLVGIGVRLLYDDNELNFPHRYLSYVSGKMNCHGDGETSYKRIDEFVKVHPCPCPRSAPGYTGTDKCKPSGTLTCFIDEAEFFGQAHKFRTTSLNTIKGILGGIELIKSATGGKIAGLPLMLNLNAKHTSTPNGVTTTIYVVSICYRGNMADLREDVLKIMSAEKQYLVGMDTIEKEAKETLQLPYHELVASEEKEFIEEFFPDAVVVGEDSQSGSEEETKTVNPEHKENQPGQETTKNKPDNKPNTSQEEPGNQERHPRYEKSLTPVGNYGKIYNRFVEEKDVDAAMKFVNRLQAGNLIYWLEKKHHDINFQTGAKKPELLKIVKNILTTALPGGESVEPGSAGKESSNSVDQENSAAKCIKCGSLLMESDSGLVCPNGHPQEVTQKPENKPDDTGSEENAVYPSGWDDSPSIKEQKDLLRIMVALKVQLEKDGVLFPDKWGEHVGYFMDESGQPIKSAQDMTVTQGKTFITMLNLSLKTSLESATKDMMLENGWAEDASGLALIPF